MPALALHVRPLLVDLIDQFAEIQGDTPAVIADHAVLSYREISQRSNALAHSLLANGVSSETFVGILLERSVDMIVAVLAVWKAGCAYVPLDPRYPHERLELMRVDAQLTHIIAQSSTCGIFSGYSGAVYDIEKMALVQTARAPELVIKPQQCAYVIYTSGSTGRPKGVMIDHMSLNGFIQWLNSYFDPEVRRYVLASNSLSFDVSVMEFSAALSCGGTLVIVRSILDLITRPPRTPVTFACAVASPLAEVVRAHAIPASLHTVMVGGETLSRQFADEIYATTNVQQVYNAWGVTEDTISATIYPVPRHGSGEPSIGTATQGRTIHLLDDQLQPVPSGTPGELCCAGYGVGLGYLGQPKLTAERFIANPFGTSDRLYRTGDFAVEDPVTGMLKFLGRSDSQVKIRGYRVELGEIEARIHEHPDIAQAVVIVKPISGQPTIALFAIPRPGKKLDLTSIQAFVAARLPAHMMPSSLTVVSIFPYGPSGKVDRKALSAQRRTRPELDTAYEAPKSQNEYKIAELFSELLEVDNIGVHDNFFALGGQSLLATRAITEVVHQFAAEVRLLNHDSDKDGQGILLTAFFACPTIDHLVATLERRYDSADSETKNGVRCLNTGQPDVTPLFFFHGVLAAEALYVWNIAQGIDSKRPFYAFAPHGYDHRHVPKNIETMAQIDRERIQAIQPHGPYELAGFCNGGMVAFEVARQLLAQGEEVRKLVLIATPGTNPRVTKFYSLLERLNGPRPFHAVRRCWIFFKINLRRQFERVLKYASNPGLLLSRRRAKIGNTPFTAQPAPADANVFRSRDQLENERYYAILGACKTYIPLAYEGHIELIWGEDDGYLKISNQEDNWKHVASSLNCTYLPGGHYFIEQQPELLLPFLGDGTASAAGL